MNTSRMLMTSITSDETSMNDIARLLKLAGVCCTCIGYVESGATDEGCQGTCSRAGPVFCSYCPRPCGFCSHVLFVVVPSGYCNTLYIKVLAVDMQVTCYAASESRAQGDSGPQPPTAWSA